MVKRKTCVFISGKGTNLKNLISQSRDSSFPIIISLVISNNKKADGLKFAKKYKIPNICISTNNRLYENEILLNLKKYNITAVDTLIMINWPHTLPLKSICSAVKELKNVVDLKYLVIDLIRENANGYQYKHRTFDLQILGRIESIKDGGDGLREIVLVKLL